MVLVPLVLVLVIAGLLIPLLPIDATIRNLILAVIVIATLVYLLAYCAPLGWHR